MQYLTKIFLLNVAWLASFAASNAPAPLSAPADNADQIEPYASLSVSELVQARKASFWMSAALMGSMHSTIRDGGDVRALTLSARALERWATILPTLFPEGSADNTSNALPPVWDERQVFEDLAQTYSDRASKLAELAEAGDAAAFEAQWMLVRESCSSCHNQFRREPSR